MTRRRWKLLCISTLAIFAPENVSAQAPGPHEGAAYIRYTQISPGVRSAICGNPYTVEIQRNGRVRYFGARCVRELGERELVIDADKASHWIDAMIGAGFFSQPGNTTYMTDFDEYLLEVFDGQKVHRVRTSMYGSKLPTEIRKAFQDLHKTINPVDRWACIPGDWRQCSQMNK